jgi:hypothetical protein
MGMLQERWNTGNYQTHFFLNSYFFSRLIGDNGLQCSPISTNAYVLYLHVRIGILLQRATARSARSDSP